MASNIFELEDEFDEEEFDEDENIVESSIIQWYEKKTYFPLTFFPKRIDCEFRRVMKIWKVTAVFVGKVVVGELLPMEISPGIT